MSESYFSPKNLQKSPVKFRTYMADALDARQACNPGKEARIPLGNWAEWKGVLDPLGTGRPAVSEFNVELLGEPGEPDQMIAVMMRGVIDPRTDEWVGAQPVAREKATPEQAWAALDALLTPKATVDEKNRAKLRDAILAMPAGTPFLVLAGNQKPGREPDRPAGTRSSAVVCAGEARGA